MSWADEVRRELVQASISPGEADEIAQSAQAEADAAGVGPAGLFGPAVIYARELAAALRTEQPARDPHFPAPASEVVLRLRGVGVRRGRRQVLAGVDLEVRTGQVVAVVGANGAGKSTLLQVCAGLMKHTTGAVERVPDFGYCPQAVVQAPLLSIDEHLALFGAAGGMSSGQAIATGRRLLAALGWKADGRQRVGTLSGGSQQKVNVALAQLASPRLLLLDEPYQGFDALSYDDLWALVDSWRRAGAGVLIVTHLLRETSRVDHVLELPAPEQRLS